MAPDIEARRRRGRDWAQRNYAAPSAPEWICERCGRRFHRVSMARRSPRFCSRGCSDAARHGRPTRGTLEERFWLHVDASAGPDECWPWTGAHIETGYGRFYFDGRMRPATHAALVIGRGIRISKGQVARHRCDNPPCVNWAHLDTGTQLDNRRDSVVRGRAVAGSRVGTARLNEAKVRLIRELAATGLSHQAIGKRVGCHQTTVTRILAGRIWKSVM